MQYTKHPERTPRHLLSSPIIYGMIIPMVFLDLCTEIYHRICFPLYGIPYVSRSRYIKIDRYKLSKLNGMQKLNCVYCGYVNGLLRYVSMIAGETEIYWCGIKHSPSKDFSPPEHHKDFIDYQEMA